MPCSREISCSRNEPFFYMLRRGLFFIQKVRFRTEIGTPFSQTKNLKRFTTSPIRWKDDKSSSNDLEDVPRFMATKYEPFSEINAPVILDIEEERRKIEDPDVSEHIYDPFEGIKTTRGLTGVFDIEDLVELLHKEKAEDLFVVRIPKEYRYADYMVIVTGRSARHMTAMAEFVRRVYKKKMSPKDVIPAIEGKSSTDWKAIDLNNIVLHIFSKSARKHYDLETLWSVGKEFDTLSQKKTEDEILITDYSTILAQLMPDTPSSNNDEDEIQMKS